MNWRMIDSHAHLDDRAFEADRAAIIATCFDDGIGVVTIGADLDSSREAVRLAARHEGIWAAVGVHPHDAKTLTSDLVAELEAMSEGAVAIGEIGLDYYRDLSPRDVQRRVFAEQLELARRVDRPVVLHNRDSTDDLLAILREVGSAHRGVVHSFLGGLDDAEAYLDLGLHLGIGGPITFPKRGELRDVIRALPLDRLLVETDCPYLTPVPYRGRRNQPAYVRFVAETMAEIKGLPFDAVSAETTRSARALFRI